VELILDGNDSTTSISEAATLLIQHLQRRTTETVPSRISNDDILGKLRNWKENTTTSPSGLHLGHYHCAWKKPKMHPGDPQLEVIETQQKQLLQATTSLLNYAIKFGYVYHRWTKVVNVMLQKDPGNPRIHRLRIIHLYEADYNLLLAVKWRQGMYKAESKKLLNDGLYGSRPGRSAHDPAFIEVLQNEIYRMSMKSGVNFDLDATSCYDRIVPSVAAISSRRVGMPKSVVHVNMAMIEGTRYHLKTNLGVSTGYYTHHQETPIYGTGQGSGNSPSLWCFVCSTLFDALESQAHGATFRNYNNDATVSLYMIGFVDDCTQRVNKFDNNIQPTSTELRQIMTKDVQLWNDLLWASGGALEQQKCSFHLIQSNWNTNGHPFLKGGIENDCIYIGHEGRNIPTTQKSNYEAHKTLGCFINPAYNNTQAWQAIKKKNNQYATMLETNYFSHQEAWTYYSAFYLPSITYPLPITPLTKAQCSQLDSRFLRTLLPRCGYNRNMASQVRYAPFNMGGAGFKQTYVEQGILMLQLTLKFLNSPTTTIGRLLRSTMSWTQAFLGTSELFLTNTESPIPPSGPSFLLDIRTFLQQHEGTIKLEEAPVSPPLRENDRHIMDIAMHQRQWKSKHLIQINSCRRYLQAQTLSDITTIQGTRIQPGCITGDIHKDHKTVRVALFNQMKPGPNAWKTWRRFLSTLCNQQAVLYQPLNRWIADISRIRHWPPFVYNETTDTLFSHHDGATYYLHQRLRPGVFSVRAITEPTTATGYPTATTIIMDTLRPTCNYLPRPPNPPLAEIHILDQVIPVDEW